jgi:hypothetical protein
MHHFAAREMTRPLLYRAFGLTIASGLPLPELPEAAGEPDVEIVTGRVPPQLPGAVRRGVRFQVAPGELLLQVDGVARYLARGGAQIVVDRAADAPPESVRLFLLGSVFAALLHERGVLPLSASAIATQRGAAVFMGLSGTGKSTLAAGFHQKGYRVLTDDLCAISFRAGAPMAWPAHPQLKLWPNVLERLGVDPAPLRRVRPELEKRALPLGDAFASEPLTPIRLYLLRGAGKPNGVELLPVEGQGKIAKLGIHTYGSQFVEGLGSEASCFENLAMLAAALPIAAVTRPDGRFTLEELIDRIEEDVGA